MLCADKPMCAQERTNGIRVSIATDADDHASNLTGWKQAYDQLAPGRFRGTLREFWLGPEMQIFEETTSHAVRQSCEVWKDAVWFGIPAEDGPPGRIGLRSFDRSDIAVRPGGMQFELLTPSSFRIFGLVIQKQVLLNFVAETQQDVLAPFVLDCEILHSCHAERRRLEAILFAVFQESRLSLNHRHALDALRDDLLGVITSNCIAGMASDIPSLTYTGRHRLVQRVRDFALVHRDEPISIPLLCRTFHVSRRTLQYAFQEVSGISPSAYLRTLRLNGVRRALREPQQPRIDVQDLAAQWGFWNPSQFACDYKKLFGERPSDTLLRRH
jgi:AraC family ethanolamine operon transcriptional activator